MSYYYWYKLAYRKDGKLYPLGPFDYTGELRSVVVRSGSFASDLHDEFKIVQDEMISDELRRAFSYTDYEGKEKMQTVRYLPLNELPSGDYIRKGYFLIEDVKLYEERHDSWDLFYEHVSPTVYAALLQHEAQFGKPAPIKDAEGNIVDVYSASDYMYYAYPDYQSREYESFLIRAAAGMLDEFEELEVIVLEMEG